MSENALNCLLKFAVGVKHIFLSLSFLTNMILPTLFFALWLGVFAIAYTKNGEYQAPPGLLYMQQEDEQNKRRDMLVEGLQKAHKLSNASSILFTKDTNATLDGLGIPNE